MKRSLSANDISSLEKVDIKSWTENSTTEPTDPPSPIIPQPDPITATIDMVEIAHSHPSPVIPQPDPITDRGRVKDGQIASLREAVIEAVTDDLAPHFRDQRPQLENLLTALTEAKLSKSIPEPFPEARFDAICATCNITGTTKTDIKTDVTRLYDFLNYPKLQKDNAFGNPDYAPSDYKKAVNMAIEQSLNASYEALTAQPRPEQPPEQEDAVPIRNMWNLYGLLGGTERAPIPQGDIETGVIEPIQEQRAARFQLAPEGSGDGVVGKVAGYTGVTVINLLTIDSMVAGSSMLFSSEKSNFFDNIPVEQETFFNILAVSSALAGQGFEQIGNPRRINTAGAAAGLLAYSALSSNSDITPFLIKATGTLLAVQVAGVIEKIPIVNRVLGTAKEAAFRTGTWAAGVIMERAAQHQQAHRE